MQLFHFALIAIECNLWFGSQQTGHRTQPAHVNSIVAPVERVSRQRHGLFEEVHFAFFPCKPAPYLIGRPDIIRTLVQYAESHIPGGKPWGNNILCNGAVSEQFSELRGVAV